MIPGTCKLFQAEDSFTIRLELLFQDKSDDAPGWPTSPTLMPVRRGIVILSNAEKSNSNAKSHVVQVIDRDVRLTGVGETHDPCTSILFGG